jgi:hypothetical protein
LFPDQDVKLGDEKPEKKCKPVYLKDYEREQLLKKGR